MKIFITGATGFIGKHLVKQLLIDGNNITINIFGDEQNPFGDNVSSYKFGNKLITDDIVFFSDQQFDGVIHLASYIQSNNHNSIDISNLINSNILFSTLILEAAVQAKVKWFINTGTYWQYFNNQSYSPVNIYASTKQAFCDLAKYYWDTNMIMFNTIILYDTYGPNDTRPKIFTLWERIARTGESLDMSAGEQLIDISHVNDIVSAFTLLATHLQNNHSQVCNGDFFAVKAKQRYTLKQLASVYENATGSKLNINWGARPYREREVMTPWENGVVVPGWEPKMDIENGIRSLIPV